MPSGAKHIDLRSNLIEKRYLGMKQTPQCFFRFSLAIILSEIIANVFEKIAIF